MKFTFKVENFGEMINFSKKWFQINQNWPTTFQKVTNNLIILARLTFLSNFDHLLVNCDPFQPALANLDKV